MAEMPEASVDAVVCDPPYGLEFMGKDWDRLGGAQIRQPSERDRGPGAAHNGSTSLVARNLPDAYVAGARMQEWHEAWAREALRVLKPGGHLLAFGGTRTYHRLACAVEDAGFEIRDCIAWMYAQGFPKSLNVGCRCDDDMRRVRPNVQSAAESSSAGEGADMLSPMQRGASGPRVGNTWLEGAAGKGDGSAGDARTCEPGVEGRGDAAPPEGQLRAGAVRPSAGLGAADGSEGPLRDGASAGDGETRSAAADADGVRAPHRPRPAEQRSGELGAVADEPGSQVGGGWPLCTRCGKPAAGLGTALKPAFEPIVVARKPLAGTVAANVLAHGTGALNVDGCRIGMTDEDRERTAARNRHAEWGSGARDNAVYGEDKRTRGEGGDWNPAGRWPANVVLSHSEGCRLAGERRVASDGHFPAARGASGYGSGVEGSNGGGLRGQEGLEERFLAGELVEVWECVEGCAVRMLDEQTGQRRSAGFYEKGARGVGEKLGAASIPIDGLSSASYADEGGASRFFYTAKASRAERDAGLREGLPRARRRRKRYQQDAADRWWPRARNRHPTVKPIDLMRWLVRLVTPPGGRVLDPFCGSGTTGCAAVLEGFEFVGVERDPEYVAIAEARVRFWVEHPTGLAVEAALEGEARRGRARDAGQLGLGF